jgi:RNA polymerase sigma-70 factor (ECF subfamily)
MTDQQRALAIDAVLRRLDVPAEPEDAYVRSSADALRQRADASSASDESEAHDRVDAAELVRRADVLTQLGRLPARERDPLLLHVMHGLQYHEIAQRLGIPLGTVQSRISRGRSKLRRALPIEEGGEA